jgi:mRNA interferase MazF
MPNQIQFMTMSDFNFGDIVLIKFPFTDISGVKKRPALILHNTKDNDIIVCRITSQAKQTEFDIEISDWQISGLKLPSTIKAT